MSTHCTIHHIPDQKLTVSDPLAPTGKRAGDYFVSFPSAIADKLPGSFLDPDNFIQKLGIAHAQASDLLGERLSRGEPLVSHIQDDVRVMIFHGSTNCRALALSQLAYRTFDTSENRAHYQRHMYKLLDPTLSYVDHNEYDYWIVEDCLASGDTLIGVLTLLAQRQARLRVRIDVVVATTIGIELLLQFAHTLHISLTLCVGYLAYGLSSGTKRGSARIHANYITYPERLLPRLSTPTRELLASLQSSRGPLYVVGDMGDAAKSLPDEYDDTAPWNTHRDDPHGERTRHKGKDRSIAPPTAPSMMYFANGGYLLRSYIKERRLDQGRRELMVSAKRIWSDIPRYGYGVLISFPHGKPDR